MKINIIGSILGVDGYNSHCRGLSNSLYKLNPDIKLDIPLSPTWAQSVNDAELDMIKKEGRTPDATIMIAQPQFWRIGLGDNCGKFIGYCVWEGDRCPLYWTEYFMDDKVSQIWVPSEHTKKAILNTDIGLNHYYENKIKVLPHGYSQDTFTSNDKDGAVITSQSPDNTFRFICNKGWRGGMEDRGGVQFVLQAFADEFQKDENVELLLKLNPSYIQAPQVKQHIDALNLPKGCGKIKVACTNVTPQQIAELYRDSDVCVCATRAESFDLGTAEAMACGLPIITTGYGGQIEHMDWTCSDLINYDLKEVKGDVNYEGVKQAVPSIGHLRRLMREAFENRDETKKKGLAAKEFIKKFTWDTTATKAMGYLND